MAFFANVKSVLSGDTLVLTSTQNPTLERIFSLAFVSAPRLNKDGDEPFAFQSREVLRKLAISKKIKATVLYTVPGSGRDYGTAEFQDGTQLPDALVSAGAVKVREDAGKKEESEEVLDRLDKLRNLEAQAKNENKGIHSGTNNSIAVQNDLGGPEFMKEWKGKTVDGIVERVISGDRLLVRLLLTEKKHWQVMTLIAGIRTPSTERVNQSNGQTQPAEEYGNEARAFTEQRLLQREVQIKIVGASPQAQLVAAVIHPAGNIAEFLLKEGLARCNDFHSTMLGPDMAALRAAEKQAQEKHLRLHKHHVAKSTDSKDVEMTVTKIFGADTIYVRNKAGVEKRISLSSVRGPRAGEASEAPFRDEAKEFLRKKLIGKHVKITIDGSKPATEGFEARDVATVLQNGKNIGLQLVQEGYCTVIRHRKDDTDRASNYDELLAAQETAKEEKKGIWSGKAPKVKQFADMSESAQKARIQLSTLARQRKVPGVVDFCKSGSRFTILIPRENAKLTLVLAGVRAPRAGRGQEKGEPFGDEALELANKRCNQRDCEINVYDIDKVGGFIGDLFVNRESFAKLLVEEGLASVHEYSAEKSGNAAELLAAQKAAKEGRKGMWHDWDPSQEADEQVEAAPAESASAAEVTLDKKPTDYRDIVITNVDPAGKLKIQEVGKGTAALTTLMSEFKKFHSDSKNNVAVKENPKAGDFVAARFSADGEWYRARIRSNDRAAKVAEVVYIDYGNSEKQPWSKLRPLDQQFSTQRLKAQAVDAQLSFVQLPQSPDYLNDAINFIYEVTEGKQLVGSFDFVDTKENISYITIFDPKSKAADKVEESVNREIILNGHAMVPRKLKPWERSKVFEPILKSLKEAETQAKNDRLGMWEYGDLTED
ncbi:hypothetical protein B0H66DRAFT_469854 [Apodospora peruviana]|uniref:Probable endonuclease LCL3 n=1 Tax=Apodospora peruviana TaxID=516989 RepID=A0AAE0MH87_9PEZI|nr:hypothetical protein B0H66DRAFT_469854 [Apodospora peruviana]